MNTHCASTRQIPRGEQAGTGPRKRFRQSRQTNRQRQAMSAHGKNRLMEAVRKVVLLQQVPDAEMLADSSAFQRFGLRVAAFRSRLRHRRLFQAPQHTLLHPRRSVRSHRQASLSGTERWVAATCHVAVVAAFASRRAYATSAVELPAKTYIWFADEPKHFLFLSGSPQASAEFLSARFAAK